MNTTTAYDEAATAAEAASEAAKVTPSKEAFQKSAQMHLAAARLAKRVGKADEMNAHNAEGEASLKVAKRLEAGMTGEEVTAALVKLDAAGTSEGVAKEWIARRQKAASLSVAADEASVAANKSGHGSDHMEAASAHDMAAHAYDDAKHEHYRLGSVMSGSGQKGKRAHLQMARETAARASSHRQQALNHEDAAANAFDAADGTPNFAIVASNSSRMVANTELQAGIVAGGYSYNDFQANVRDAVAGNAVLTTCPQGADGKLCSPCGGPWVADIICPKHEEGETWKAVVQGADGKLYLVNFKVGKDGIAIEGDPKQVEKVTDYDYVMQPTTPAKVAGADATPSTALDASRATDAAKNRYAMAATDAQAASNGIKPAHKKAMHLHKIASECAGMCGDDTSKAMHDGKAAKHAAALEAEDAMDDSDMMAGNAAGAGALEAGGPGSGPRKGMTLYRVHDEGDEKYIHAASPEEAAHKYGGVTSKYDTAEMKDGETNTINVRHAETNELLKTATQTANGRGGVKSLRIDASNTTTAASLDEDALEAGGNSEGAKLGWRHRMGMPTTNELAKASSDASAASSKAIESGKAIDHLAAKTAHQEAQDVNEKALEHSEDSKARRYYSGRSEFHGKMADAHLVGAIKTDASNATETAALHAATAHKAGTIILPGLPKTASSMSVDLTKLAVDKGKAANSFPSKVNHQAASEAHAMAATHYPKDSFMNISHTNAASEFAAKASIIKE